MNNMERLTDDQLLALLADIESDRTERKERLAGDAPTALREAICAFANDLPNHRAAGVAFVGATNEGHPAGTPITDDLLRALADMKTDGNIQPLPTMTVEKRLLAGHQYAVVTVAPSDQPPVRYKGRIWIRVGPRRAYASAQDERILTERRRSRDLPFDVQSIPSSNLSYLERSLFEDQYLPAAFAVDVLEQNKRSFEERLASLRMIASSEVPTPTLLGLLVLSQRAIDFVPCAFVQFLRIHSDTLDGPIVDEDRISAPLAQLVRRLDDKLGTHLRTAVDLTSGSLEARSPDYPFVALQQLVRNAVMHRTYEGTHAPIRVTWFDDRVEVLSPGGPFGLVTASNFGTPGVTDYRNPNIADAMKTLGFVQRFGVGIAIAKRAAERNGNPPITWQVNDRFVLATLWRRP